MANYFRETLHLFDSASEQFARFDYVIRRRLDARRCTYFTSWRNGFIEGLRQAAELDNIYIAAVFHNVLATYYLNRSGRTSPYQLQRLKKRKVYLDTNVFYSLMVAASPYHDATTHFVERLAGMGVRSRLLPVSLHEYEVALEFVENGYTSDGGPSEWLIRKNPWLYQEFMSNPGAYLNSIAVCRQRHSICARVTVNEENHEKLNERLGAKGVELDKDYEILPNKEAEDLWTELRNLMTSSHWDMARYWEFIYKDIPLSVKVHDMTCLRKLQALSEASGSDALGQEVLFVTVDSKLWRLRRRYPFILSPEQFLEFILPYLFMSDIPISDAEQFPNRLLATQLGTLLVKRPPQLTEMIRAFFRNPPLAGQDAREVFRDVTDEDARALNQERFKSAVKRSASLTDEEREELATQTAAAYGELSELRQAQSQYTRELEELRAHLAQRDEQLRESDKKARKLQQTVKYLKEQKARRG